MKTILAGLFILMTTLCLSAELPAACLLRGVSYLETGGERPDIAVADFNGDGFSDLALAGAEAGVVRVYLNQGDGSFALVDEKHFESPSKIKAGDVDGDGTPDLAVSAARSIVILQNDGAGKMRILAHVPARAQAIAFADFNMDFRADLAFLTREGDRGTVTVLSNSGGSWIRTQTLPVKSPSDLVAAAIGSARYTALLVSSDSGTLSVFPGTGGGTFLAAVVVPGVHGPSRITTGWIDGDRKLDLVLAGFDGEAAVLLGQGETTFRRLPLRTGSPIQGLALGDFNSDGHSDLWLINRNSRITLYSGDGHGGFRMYRGYGWGFFTGPLAVEDFNRDGKADFVAAENGAAGIFLANDSSSFGGGFRTILKQGGKVAAGDFNADGLQDLLVSGNHGSVLLQGNGNGTFKSPSAAILPQLGYVAVADFNQDGLDDIAGFDRLNLKTWINNLELGFKETASVSLSIDPPVQVIDINQDGFDDLAVLLPGRLHILLNKTNGTFEALRPIPFPKQKKGTLADLNNDGFPDVVTIAESDPPTLHVFLGGANLTYAGNIELPLSACPGAVTTGDANGDGLIDVVVGSRCKSYVQLFLGDGTGNFSTSRNIPSGNGSAEPVLVDLNGDGKAEIVAIANTLGKPSISRVGSRNPDLIGPYNWNAFAIADFDRDGHPDLVASSFNSTALFLNCQ